MNRGLASERPCGYCGKPFQPRQRVLAKGFGLYCSRLCGQTARRGQVLRGKTTDERFWRHVDRRGDDECWPWMGVRQPSGHGQFAIATRPGKLTAAHRYAWTLANGPIPDGMKVCHRCDHGWCVNPAHLFLGTQADNLRDMREKDRHSRGERHYAAKFCDEDVLLIRAMAGSGVSQSEIALRFNTRQSEISNIVSGKRWKHLLGKVA